MTVFRLLTFVALTSAAGCCPSASTVLDAQLHTSALRHIAPAYAAAADAALRAWVLAVCDRQPSWKCDELLAEYRRRAEALRSECVRKGAPLPPAPSLLE